MTTRAAAETAYDSQTGQNNRMGSVGLIADTHDETHIIEFAVELFRAQGCHTVIHAGDIESANALRLFEPLTANGVNLYWILGEHDSDEVAISIAAAELGATRLDSAQVVSIDGLRVATIHNPYGGKAQRRPFLLERLCNPSAGLDLVVYGHFHYFNIKYPSTRAPAAVVCPGGCRRDVSPQTVAILKTEHRELSVFALDPVAGRCELAFSTRLLPDVARRLTAGPGLTATFKEGIAGNLRAPNRDYWRINDRWGAESLSDWLDPQAVIDLDNGAA